MFRTTLWITFLVLSFSTFAFASGQGLYFLCGPDEDGCPSNGYEYCVCIAFDEQQGMHPYCLNFEKGNCIPIKNEPDCDSNLIFDNQASCIATLVQSVPSPPCPLKTRSFCEKHHILICEKDDSSCFGSR